MKIAIVHDDLVQWGGAERVLKTVSDMFPDAPIFTSLIDDSNIGIYEAFKKKIVVTSFMQQIPLHKRLYKALLPLYPIAFEQFTFDDYDVVLSLTTRFAKSVITKPETIHICYCHTPPRFVWGYPGGKVSRILSPYISILKLYDQISSKRVDKWIAGSFNAQRRIKKVYGAESVVLQPFVDLGEFKNLKIYDGGYYLIMARLAPYKRVDLAVKAFNQLGLPLKVVGRGPEFQKLKSQAKSNIEFFAFVSDQKRLELLAGCKALVLCAEEDFGLTPIEAQAAGKPVIAYKAGGAIETVIEGKTGVFFDSQTVESLVSAVRSFEKMKFDAKDCLKNAAKFSKARFEKELKNIINSFVGIQSVILTNKVRENIKVRKNKPVLISEPQLSR